MRKAASASDKLYARLKPCLDGLDGIELELTDDLLKTYCWLTVKVDELTAAIESEGPVIETPRGPKTNPANTVLHQYTQRKADYYTRIMKAVSKAGVASADRLAAFVGR